MNFLCPFFIAFSFIFLSELGDKTQLLVLSFSSKLKAYSILLGVALGSFFSHGIAIIFGSALGSLNEPFIQSTLKIITYLTFIFFGIIILINKNSKNEDTNDTKLAKKLSNLRIGFIFIIAITIAIGEFGDKTFLAALGLGIDYPNYKIQLILGAISGMVISDWIAIILGKFLTTKIPTATIDTISGLLFILFGILGFVI